MTVVPTSEEFLHDVIPYIELRTDIKDQIDNSRGNPEIMNALSEATKPVDSRINEQWIEASLGYAEALGGTAVRLLRDDDVELLTQFLTLQGLFGARQMSHGHAKYLKNFEKQFNIARLAHQTEDGMASILNQTKGLRPRDKTRLPEFGSIGETLLFRYSGKPQIAIETPKNRAAVIALQLPYKVQIENGKSQTITDDGIAMIKSDEQVRDYTNGLPKLPALEKEVLRAVHSGPLNLAAITKGIFLALSTGRQVLPKRIVLRSERIFDLKAAADARVRARRFGIDISLV